MQTSNTYSATLCVCVCVCVCVFSGEATIFRSCLNCTICIWNFFSLGWSPKMTLRIKGMVEKKRGPKHSLTTSLQWTHCSPPAYILSIHFYLRRRDDLWTMDNMLVPHVSIIRRFHCTRRVALVLATCVSSWHSTCCVDGGCGIRSIEVLGKWCPHTTAIWGNSLHTHHTNELVLPEPTQDVVHPRRECILLYPVFPPNEEVQHPPNYRVHAAQDSSIS